MAGNTIPEQDEYLWDTEQIRGSRDEINKASDVLNDAETRLRELQTRLLSVWDSSEASVEYQKRLDVLLKDIAICSENLRGFAKVVDEVTTIYDNTEDDLGRQFEAIDGEMTPVESAVDQA